MKGGQTPVHVQRWSPADYQADPWVQVLITRQDWPTLHFYRQFIDLSFLQGGDLPADAEVLAAAVRMPLDLVEKAVATLEGRLLFREGDTLYQKRVRRDIEAELAYRTEQSRLGKEGARKRWGTPVDRVPYGVALGVPQGSYGPPAPTPISPSSSPPVPSYEGTSGESEGVGPARAGRDPSPARKVFLAEIEWRLETAWTTHLLARRRFFESANGRSPGGPEPTRTKEIEKAIRDALREHDKERLGADQRDAWKRESPVRAAGIGIFLSPFHTGRSEKSEGQQYLEPWRPWKRQRGKPDPIEMFAKFYFDEKARPR